MIRRLLPRLMGAGAVLAVAFLAMPAMSRPTGEEEKPLGKISSDLALVPRDALYFASVRVASMAEQPAVKALLGKAPFDKAMDAMKSAVGFGPDGLERVTAFARTFRGNNPNLVIFRARKAYDKETIKKLLRLDQTTTIHGKEVCHSDGWRHGISIWMADDKTLVLGGATALVPYLATLARPGKTHVYADELKEADGTHVATIAVLPSLAFRVANAEMRAERERWRNRKTAPRRDFKIAPPPPPKFPRKKESPVKDKIGSRVPDGAFRVSFQKDKDGRRPGIEELKDEPLKLLGLEEIFEQPSMGMGMQEMVFKPAIRCRRVLLTFDLAPRAADLTMKARLSFASEAEASDGQALTDYGRVVGRELLMLPESVRKKHAEIAAAIKPFRDALASAEVKRDGKVVTTVVDARLDLPTLVEGAIRSGPFFLGGSPARRRPSYEYKEARPSKEARPGTDYKRPVEKRFPSKDAK